VIERKESPSPVLIFQSVFQGGRENTANNVNGSVALFPPEAGFRPPTRLPLLIAISP
jgi:hypothetical protein